jgi:hypothetical protein
MTQRNKEDATMLKRRKITMGFDNKPVTIEQIIAHLAKTCGRKKNNSSVKEIVPQPSDRL